MTSKTINIKPKSAKVKVRKPDGSYLEEKGETVKRNAFWVRRINDGDVVAAETEKASAKTNGEKK